MFFCSHVVCNKVVNSPQKCFASTTVFKQYLQATSKVLCTQCPLTLRIESKPNKGRCVIAEADIPTDSILVRFNNTKMLRFNSTRAPSYAKVVHYAANEEFCAHCHQSLKGIDQKPYHSRFTRSNYGSAYCRGDSSLETTC